MFTKHMKHWLATVAMLLCSLVASAYDFKVDGIYYNITTSTKRTVAVTKGADKYSGTVTIPATVTYNDVEYSVTSIGSSAFEDCSKLTAITIPEGVTSIGDHAFSGCYSLKSITIPEGVTSIGDYAFSYCSSLTSITFPEGVTSIGDDAFAHCRSLTSITLPEGVTNIGDRAFWDCTRH